MTREQEFEARLKGLAGHDAALLVKALTKYGDSWRKRGGWEAFANLSRKWDRIERSAERYGRDIFAACEKECATDGTIDGKDSLLDDIGDLRRYLMLVEEFVTRPDPIYREPQS